MDLRPTSGTIPSGIHRTSTQPVDNYSDAEPPVDNGDRRTTQLPPHSRAVRQGEPHLLPCSGELTTAIDTLARTDPEIDAHTEIEIGAAIIREHLRFPLRNINSGNSVIVTRSAISVRVREPRTGSLEG